MTKSRIKQEHSSVAYLKREGYVDVMIQVYCSDGKKYRPFAGVRIDPNHLLSSGKISRKHPNYAEDILRIKSFHRRMEGLIRFHIEQFGNKPAKAWLTDALKKSKARTPSPLVAFPDLSSEFPGQISQLSLPQTHPATRSVARQVPRSSFSRAGEGSSRVHATPAPGAGCHQSPGLEATNDELFFFWNDFRKFKLGMVRRDSTLNSYESLKTALLRFKESKHQVLSFSVLDQIFFNDFIYYLIREHNCQDHIKGDKRLLPEVGVVNETAIKRIKEFKEYLKYCSLQGVPINTHWIDVFIKAAKHKHGVTPMSKTHRWELTLTPDEIEFVVNLHQYATDFWKSISANQKRFLDIFIFMCLQGTAPIDTKDICKPDIREGQIVKERSKSGNDFRVELDPLAEEILIRHNYDLKFGDSHLNEELKYLFVTIFELYRLHFEKNHERPYALLCSQRSRKGDRDVYEIKHKGLWVELMTGRRSFITNLLKVAGGERDLKTAMEMTGHVRVETLLGYAHRQQDLRPKEDGLFGIRKISS